MSVGETQASVAYVKIQSMLSECAARLRAIALQGMQKPAKPIYSIFLNVES